MRIYLRVHKDHGYHVAHLWSKHIKEQIIETVNFACDSHDGCIGEPALFPTFWQQEIHSRRLYVGDPKKCKYWLNPPMYALSFVWEKADFDFEDDYYWLCDNAKLPYDFTCQPRINDQYNVDVYIGSYVKGLTEPLTLPGLLFDPEYEEDGEVLVDSMFVELKKKQRMKTCITVISFFIMLLASCQNKSQNASIDNPIDKSDSIETYHTIISDDSLVTAIWHDTCEGGTAPDIDCVVKFKSADGKQHEEHRPLLQLAHPKDDYSHHEVQKIVSIDDEYGNRSYIFFLSAKVGSNEYAHDIVAFEISGDSLRYLYNYKID